MVRVVWARHLSLRAFVRGDIRDVDNHLDLYNAISRYGSNKVSNGAVVRVAQGNYEGAPYHNSTAVYYLEDEYIDLVCTNQPHSCVLDGNNERQIMWIWGTSSGTLKIAGIMFDNGNNNGGGGGLYLGGSQY